jgi:hypothetical protein
VFFRGQDTPLTRISVAETMIESASDRLGLSSFAKSFLAESKSSIRQPKMTLHIVQRMRLDLSRMQVVQARLRLGDILDVFSVLQDGVRQERIQTAPASAAKAAMRATAPSSRLGCREPR